MIIEIFQILLWVTAILLVVSGIDDFYLDLMYWLRRGKYKRNLPDFNEMKRKPERPISIMIGAWQEHKVIGRTLKNALRNIEYTNYKIFVAVYPNDLKTVKVVRDFARKDQRVILCLNPQDGPTTKADNLNNMYACVTEYERINGNFDILLVHDSEDFIHPYSLKLYNYMIMYKGHYAIQIPVIPIKNEIGKFFHRTYCDAFAELHTKDMIVRQSVSSFIPFAGTGMAFNRKAFYYLESQGKEIQASEPTITKPEVKEIPEKREEVLEEENIYSRKKSFDDLLIDKDERTQVIKKVTKEETKTEKVEEKVYR